MLLYQHSSNFLDIHSSKLDILGRKEEINAISTGSNDIDPF